MDKYFYLIDGDELCYRVALARQKSFYFVTNNERTIASKFRYKEDAAEFILNRDDLMLYKASSSPLEKLSKEERADVFLRDFNMRVKEVLSYFKQYPPCGHEIFVTGSQNFRKDLATLRQYKGHRAEKPLFIDEIRELLVMSGIADQNRFLEADDMLSISSGEKCSQGMIPIICSSDKDLATVPGLLFNMTKKTISEIDIENAQYNFYYQVLVGDDVDNIPHPTGLGSISANKILNTCKEKGLKGLDLHETIKNVYEEFLFRKNKKGEYLTKWFSDDLNFEDVFQEICDLLHMRRSANEEERYNAKEVWKL